MRHRVAGKKLGRNGTHRRAVMRNIIASLFDHERIVTTIPKAKHYRRAAEKLITLGKVKTLHNVRRAQAILQDKDMVKKLFDEIGPRMKDRPGGYTRIVKLSKRRLGDNATQAVWELVDNKVLENKLAAEAGDEE
mgnify:FL=1